MDAQDIESLDELYRAEGGSSSPMSKRKRRKSKNEVLGHPKRHRGHYKIEDKAYELKRKLEKLQTWMLLKEMTMTQTTQSSIAKKWSR